jgi:predicted nucleotidyltransferase
MKLPKPVLKGIDAGRGEIASGRSITLDEFKKRTLRANGQSRGIMDKLRKSKKGLFSRYALKSMALFGSYARNKARPDSDVDIVVEFTNPVGFEFVDLAIELEGILGLKVDLVSRRGIKPSMLPFIEKDELIV